MPPPPRPCVVCKRTYQPDRENGRVCPDPECRAQRKRDAAAARRAGGSASTTAVPVECVVCGSTFRGHPKSLTCGRTCFLARQRENARRRLGVGDYSCVVCETAITDLGDGRQRYTCSAECRAEAARRRAARVYRNNPDRRERMVAARRVRKATDPGYAARVREQDRARRQKP